MRKKIVSTAAVLLVISFLSGCYGPFNLTRKVWKWNGETEDKFGREAVFLVFCILPVYGFSVLGDSLVLNPIDFWSAKPEKKPKINKRGKSKKSKVISVNDEKAVLAPFGLNEGFGLDLIRGNNLVEHLTIENTESGAVAKNPGGAVILTAFTMLDGTLIAKDAAGRIVSSAR